MKHCPSAWVSFTFWPMVSHIRIRSLLVTVALAASLAGCGGGTLRANVSAGPMPETGGWQGRWASVQYGDMTLCQTGSQVVGTFEKDERRGRIQGTVQGDLLRFQWTERREMVQGRPNISQGRGYFQYVIGDDESHYAVGEWGHDENEVGGGPWRAVRLNLRGTQRVRCDDLTPDTSDSGRLEFGGDQSPSSSSGSSRPQPAASDDGMLEGLD